MYRIEYRYVYVNVCRKLAPCKNEIIFVFFFRLKQVVFYFTRVGYILVLNFKVRTKHFILLNCQNGRRGERDGTHTNL